MMGLKIQLSIFDQNLNQSFAKLVELSCVEIENEMGILIVKRFEFEKCCCLELGLKAPGMPTNPL